MSPLLQQLHVQQLHVQFHGAPEPTLAGIDLSVEPGCVQVILGASGAGKTTLGLTLANAIEPWQATVSGTVAPRTPGALIYLPQSPREGLCPFIPLVDQVEQMLALRPGPQRRRRALDALGRCSLDERLAARLPPALSTGECQRGLLAMAFASDASVLILDEPLESLDFPLRARLTPWLRQLASQDGRAMVLLTHDLAMARALGDQVAWLGSGCLQPLSPLEASNGPAPA